MENLNRKKHWENIYQTKDLKEVLVHYNNQKLTDRLLILNT